MDVTKEKGRKGNLIIQTWQRCKSLGRGSKRSTTGLARTLTAKSKSWPRMDGSPEDEKGPRKPRVAPEGCFSVYVGPQKQRFVIRTEYANHPLFKTLLEEAESEYGFNPEGPLALPCNVDAFYRVLMAMEASDEIRQGFGFANNCCPHRLLSPTRMVAMNDQF